MCARGPAAKVNGTLTKMLKLGNEPTAIKRRPIYRLHCTVWMV